LLLGVPKSDLLQLSTVAATLYVCHYFSRLLVSQYCYWLACLWFNPIARASSLVELDLFFSYFSLEVSSNSSELSNIYITPIMGFCQENFTNSTLKKRFLQGIFSINREVWYYHSLT